MDHYDCLYLPDNATQLKLSFTPSNTITSKKHDVTNAFLMVNLANQISRKLTKITNKKVLPLWTTIEPVSKLLAWFYW